MENFIQILKSERERLKLSQTKLSKLLNFGKNSVWQWESGQSVPSEEKQTEIITMLAKLSPASAIETPKETNAPADVPPLPDPATAPAEPSTPKTPPRPAPITHAGPIVPDRWSITP